ncbi:MAG TPA: ABC transporter ATP-binding protein [Hellea balneolensis]|uniref:ABC transporter ATP-binding protein n=1 Tax=Hellea balneolensis TaxID=287478 RepID=A0A7C5LVL8_9PROT|nr:ABC transporter ATP-binding protein [Hellea balneolensis]
MSKLIKVENVNLSYPHNYGGLQNIFKPSKPPSPALVDVSMSLDTGDRLALVGLNGSGKSTLLRVLAGIYTPDSGYVRVNGNVATLFSLGIGMRLDMSGRDNIILQGLVSGHNKDEMLEKMPKIIEFSGLADVIDQPVSSYSQGMAMRLVFTIVTSIDADILLLDEWIGAGDRIFRDKAQKRLEEMVSQARGFILASHNAMILKKYCNKALWLDAGQVVMQGDIEPVMDEFVKATTLARQHS